MVANAEAGQGVFALVCWQVISALISITEYRWNRSENTGKNGENDPVFRKTKTVVPELKVVGINIWLEFSYLFHIMQTLFLRLNNLEFSFS